jgi:hypothetical protein
MDQPHRPFLYGVAVRVEKEARVVSARRNIRESSVADVPDRSAERVVPPDPDTLRVLDEESRRCPNNCGRRSCSAN